jgi:hypothetical protein
MKMCRTWPVWLARWLAWTISTAAGWYLGWMLIMARTFAATIWDPDEVAAYARATAWQRLSPALSCGAAVGLILGVLVGLLWLALRRSRREALFSALATMLGSAVLYTLYSTGGPAQMSIVGGQIDVEPSSLIRVMLTGAVAGGAVGGAVSGFCQWLLLCRLVGKAPGWIALTITTWALGWAIWAAVAAGPSSPNAVLNSLALLAGGACNGLAQWLVLRQSVRRAGWWVLATTLGWGVPLSLRPASIASMSPYRGVLVGVVTAIALSLLCAVAGGRLQHAEETPGLTDTPTTATMG